MEYFTIDAYKDAPRVSEPYQVNGKLYTRVKCKCKRCGGRGIYQTFGICYMCNGSGYNIIETRLFTAEEKAAFAKQKAEEEDDFEREQLTRENEEKRNWLLRNNFDENGDTYIVIGDSYSIKDKLKSFGFKYSDYIKWHAATPSEDWDFTTKKVNVNDFYHWVPGLKGYLISKDGKDKLKKIYAEAPSEGEWVGNIGERVSVEVSFIGRRTFDGNWGAASLFMFDTLDHQRLIWNTTTCPIVPNADTFILTATVKKNSFDSTGRKVTYITRAKMEEPNEV